MGSAGAAGDLSDVTITSPADEDILRYNAISAQWENVAFPTPASALNDLTDVTVAAPTTNEILHYTGGNWTQAAAIDGMSVPTVLEGHLPVSIGGNTYYIQLYSVP